MNLSPRLQAIADLALPERPAADIGCDHAQLAAWWSTQAELPVVVASDIRPGPLRRARAQLEAVGAAVDLRKGDGLTVLQPGEVATIAIAGMGGHLMLELLEASPEVVKTAARIILQPNTGWEDVRRHLAARSTPLDAETLTEDRGRLFLTLAFDPGARGPAWDEADIVLGPRLRRERPPAFMRWLAERRSHLSTLEAQLTTQFGASHPRVRALQVERQRLQPSSDPKNRAR